VPEAVVLHHQQLTMSRFWRQQVSYGRGAARFRRTQRAGLERPGFYSRLVREAFTSGVGVGALVLLAQLATAAGVALERMRRVASRRA
jgi:hypothetical protein